MVCPLDTQTGIFILLFTVSFVVLCISNPLDLSIDSIFKSDMSNRFFGVYHFALLFICAKNILIGKMSRCLNDYVAVVTSIVIILLS